MRDVAHTAARDDVTRCPECGAQLVVNLRGHRRFTCGREDVILYTSDGLSWTVTSVLAPCRNAFYPASTRLNGKAVVRVNERNES